MEANTAKAIPKGDEWQYEPKWDGFRVLVFRDGDEVELQSKNGQPLARYFPELVEAVRAVKAKRFVLDGEIMVPADANHYSFDALLQRIHPAESRIKRLSNETPAIIVVFDLLVDDKGHSLTETQTRARRELLDRFFAKYLENSLFQLSPATHDRKEALKWWNATTGTLDGVIAKKANLAYQSGERTGMVKIKKLRTADCVVGGFRYASKGKEIGSLLLGLYDDQGLLNHVGFTSSIKHNERAAVTELVEQLRGGTGFTGRAPGGPSRWATERSTEWEPLHPKLVVEVEYDHFTNGRFRHGTRFLRWRPDKSADQCTFAQIPHLRGKH
jgi:ATP-dependent DNA ligase